MRRLVLASRNKGKIAELRELLIELPVEIVGLDAYPDLPEIEETGTTFLENAMIKAKAVAEYTGELSLADDSGLEVDALGGEPGVYSARYGQLGWNDRERYEYLLSKLQGIAAERLSARFHSTVALVDPVTGRLEVADGAVEGLIMDQPKGSQGFGYDPIFFLPGLGKTMAELPDSEKNSLSHRGRAIRKILPKIIECIVVNQR